jgi:hypothetical protein
MFEYDGKRLQRSENSNPGKVPHEASLCGPSLGSHGDEGCFDHRRAI